MPNKAKEILDLLDVDPSRRKLEDAKYGSNFDYGTGVQKKMLFPPLLTEE